MNMTREDIVAHLMDYGITPTHQRIEIAYALLSRAGEHLCAEQVLTLVNEKVNQVSKATVYNTLNLFVKKNLMREVIIDPERIFYDVNTKEHHHFYDVTTGKLWDIDKAIELHGMPALPPGTTTEGIDIVIRIRSAS